MIIRYALQHRGLPQALIICCLSAWLLFAPMVNAQTANDVTGFWLGTITKEFDTCGLFDDSYTLTAYAGLAPASELVAALLETSSVSRYRQIEKRDNTYIFQNREQQNGVVIVETVAITPSSNGVVVAGRSTGTVSCSWRYSGNLQKIGGARPANNIAGIWTGTIAENSDTCDFSLDSYTSLVYADLTPTGRLAVFLLPTFLYYEQIGRQGNTYTVQARIPEPQFNGEGYVATAEVTLSSGKAAVEGREELIRNGRPYCSVSSSGSLQRVVPLQLFWPYIVFAGATNVTLREGESIQFTIVAAPAPLEDVEVNLQFSGDDLVVSPNPVVIRAGQTMATASVVARDDNIPEQQERVTISLSLANQQYFARIDERSRQVVITIPTNDASVIAFSGATNVALREGEKIKFTIAAAPAPLEDIEVNLQFSGNDLVVSQNPVVIKAGQAATVVSVVARDDNTPERQERIAVNLSLISPQSLVRIDERDRQAVITIPANDPVTLSFAGATNVTLRESERAQFAIRSTPTLLEDIAVNLQFSESDLVVSQNPVVIKAGQTMAMASVVARDDNIPERQERVAVNLDLISPQGLARIDERGRQAVITIPANDTPTIVFAQTSVRIVEGATRTMTILAAPPPIDKIDLRLTSDAPSTSKIMFPASVSIPKGKRSIQFNVSVEEDDSEQTESANVTLDLMRMDAFASIGSSSKVLTIETIDNDKPNSVYFTNNALILEEGVTQTITIASKGLESPVTLTISIAEESAEQISLKDLRTNSSIPPDERMSISLPEGSSRYEIIAESLEDDVPEREQTHIVRLKLADAPIENSTLTITVPELAITIPQSGLWIRLKVYLEGALQ